MTDQLTRQDFENLGPRSLKVLAADGEIDLTVLGLRDLPNPSPRAHPFAVILEGPSNPLLPQAILPLVHPTLGRLDVFVVPIAQDARHTRYELVFN